MKGQQERQWGGGGGDTGLVEELISKRTQPLCLLQLEMWVQTASEVNSKDAAQRMQRWERKRFFEDEKRSDNSSRVPRVEGRFVFFVQAGGKVSRENRWHRKEVGRNEADFHGCYAMGWRVASSSDAGRKDERPAVVDIDEYESKRAL